VQHTQELSKGSTSQKGCQLGTLEMQPTGKERKECEEEHGQRVATHVVEGLCMNGRQVATKKRRVK
jgi:hypothetical protein